MALRSSESTMSNGNLADVIERSIAPMIDKIDTMQQGVMESLNTFGERLDRVERQVLDCTAATNAERNERDDDDPLQDKRPGGKSRALAPLDLTACRDAWDKPGFQLKLTPVIKYDPVRITISSQSRHVVKAGVAAMARRVAANEGPYGMPELLTTIVDLAVVNGRGARRPRRAAMASKPAREADPRRVPRSLAADLASLATEGDDDDAPQGRLMELCNNAVYYDDEKQSFATTLGATLRKVATSFNDNVKNMIYTSIYKEKIDVRTRAADNPRCRPACVRALPKPTHRLAPRRPWTTTASRTSKHWCARLHSRQPRPRATERRSRSPVSRRSSAASTSFPMTSSSTTRSTRRMATRHSRSLPSSTCAWRSSTMRGTSRASTSRASRN